MTITKQESSFWHYCQLLRLQAVGCLVEFPEVPKIGRQLWLRMRATYLETNVYPVPGGTAVAFWLDIRASAALTVHQFRFWAPWAAGPISWLPPSTEHDEYYCRPPGIWIQSRRVLNYRVDRWGDLRRNDHWEGFLLGTIPQTLPASAGDQLEAVVGIEDLRGYDHSLVIRLVNRSLDPDLLRRCGEAATFPSPQTPTAIPKPQPPPTSPEDTVFYRGINRIFPELEGVPVSQPMKGRNLDWKNTYGLQA